MDDFGKSLTIAGTMISLGGLIVRRRQEAGKQLPIEWQFLAKWGIAAGTCLMALGLALQGDVPFVGMP